MKVMDLLVDGEEINPGETEAWLERRKLSVGASDAATILGINPYEAPYTLYLRKRGEAPPKKVLPRMIAGQTVEPLILKEYEDRNGIALVRKQVFLSNPDLPEMTATLDAVTQGGRIVEAKYSEDPARKIGESYTSEYPIYWYAQAQAQMLITGQDHVMFACLIGSFSPDAYREFIIEAKEDFQQVLAATARDFMRRVREGDPPDTREVDLEVLRTIPFRPETQIVLPDSYQEVYDAWRSAKEEVQKIKDILKQAEERAGSLAARIIAARGDHEVAVLPNGARVIRREQTRKAYSVAESKYTVDKWVDENGRKL